FPFFSRLSGLSWFWATWSTNRAARSLLASLLPAVYCIDYGQDESTFAPSLSRGSRTVVDSDPVNRRTNAGEIARQAAGGALPDRRKATLADPGRARCGRQVACFSPEDREGQAPLLGPG